MESKGSRKHGVESFFFAFLAIFGIYLVVEFLKSDAGAVLLVLAGIGIPSIIYLNIRRNEKSREELEKSREKDDRLIGEIQQTTRGDFLRGYKIVSELGWVKGKGKQSVEEVEDALKLAAANLGANALTKMFWKTERESYQAGTGKKGNPYYRNRTIFDGEAFAVVVEQNRRDAEGRQQKKASGKNPTRKPDYKKYPGSDVILDGNNIVGFCDWDFSPLSQLICELRRSKYRYFIFFDNNIYRSLKEKNLIAKGQSIVQAIASVLDEAEQNIAVTSVGQEADQYIIDLARRRSAAIISNDNFDDYKFENLWLDESDRLLKFQAVGSEILVPRLNLA